MRSEMLIPPWELSLYQKRAFPFCTRKEIILKSSNGFIFVKDNQIRKNKSWFTDTHKPVSMWNPYEGKSEMRNRSFSGFSWRRCRQPAHVSERLAYLVGQATFFPSHPLFSLLTLHSALLFQDWNAPECKDAGSSSIIKPQRSERITFLRAISVFVTNVRKRSFAVTTDNAVPAASKRNSTCSCVDPSMHTRTLFENLRGWWTFLIKRIRNEPISGLREGSSGPIGRCISAGGIQIRTALRLEMGHACTHGPGTHAKKIRRCRPIGARRV